MDQIYKFQPHRTMRLRGFDFFGAAAALWGASDSRFNDSGVFRVLSVSLRRGDAGANFSGFCLRTGWMLPPIRLRGLQQILAHGLAVYVELLCATADSRVGSTQVCRTRRPCDLHAVQ